MPEGALTCTLWTEPTFGPGLGSSALSNATRKKVAEIRQLENGAKAERSEVVEVGGSGGSPGGWVLASTRRETEKRHCGAVAVGGDRQ
jgi:hypothetical protein